MPDLPTRTVTFLFTDIEGSTKLWEQHPDSMRAALAGHDALLRNAIETNNGCVFKPAFPFSHSKVVLRFGRGYSDPAVTPNINRCPVFWLTGPVLTTIGRVQGLVRSGY